MVDGATANLPCDELSMLVCVMYSGRFAKCYVISQNSACVAMGLNRLRVLEIGPGQPNSTNPQDRCSSSKLDPEFLRAGAEDLTNLSSLVADVEIYSSLNRVPNLLHRRTQQTSEVGCVQCHPQSPPPSYRTPVGCGELSLLTRPITP
jgi:hypothetical protein